jgi:HAD superfamily hydrolase (TIGR01509 family)
VTAELLEMVEIRHHRLHVRTAARTHRRTSEESFMLQAIFWDNDGVLVDTEELFFASNREVMAEHGVDLDHELFAEWSLRRGKSVFDMLEDTSPAEREALRDERNRRYELLLRAGVRQFPGAQQCLASLHGQLPMAVVTSAYPDHFDIIHEQTEMMQYMEFVLKGGDYDRHKPYPDPYLMAAEKQGVDPAHCLVIEDSERGLVAAVAAGMRCIVIPNPLARDADLSSAHAIVPSIDAVPEIVARLSER